MMSYSVNYKINVSEGPRVRASSASPWARHIYPSLVLDQPRKTRPYTTERLLMGRKESNQTNKCVPNVRLWMIEYGSKVFIGS